MTNTWIETHETLHRLIGRPWPAVSWEELERLRALVESQADSIWFLQGALVAAIAVVIFLCVLCHRYAVALRYELNRQRIAEYNRVNFKDYLKEISK